MKTKTLIFISIILFSFILASKAEAADYYVSPSGTASWSGCTNINTPCSAQTAMQNAVAGDTVFFRGGIYNGGESPAYHAYFEPSNSGTSDNPITFIAYPGETPTITLTLPTKPSDFAIGNGFQNYIIWDGFTVTATDGDTAGLYMAGASNDNKAIGVIIRNCTAIAGANYLPTSDNYDCSRADWVTYSTWSRNKIGNVRNGTSWTDNNAALKIYHSDNLTIEYNEFFNSVNGISAKSELNYSTIRYNYFHGNVKDFFTNVYLNYTGVSNKIYHNLLVNCASISVQINAEPGVSPWADDWEFYNNTIYSTSGNTLTFGNARSGHGWKIYNNIFSAAEEISTARECYIEECDHNQFGSGSFAIQLEIYHDYRQYNSLISWQSSGELEGSGNPGTGSLASDPKFVNTSGNMRQLDDFRLAPGSLCIGTGRGGADIGANIDLVGLNGGLGEPECNDGIDNDGDGQIDYLNDGGCLSASDNDETNCSDESCDADESCSSCPSDCGECSDTTPPSVPTNLSATAISSSQINLSWTAATDNASVTGYKIYRNGSYLISTANTSYSNIGLSAGTSYSYRVSAYDAAGNESEQSTSVSATTHRKGDINKDGQVNSTDFIRLIAKWWQTTNIADEDLNSDGLVNARDLGILMRNWFDN